MRRLLLGLLCVAGLAAPQVGAHAADAPSGVTLRGSATASVDVSLPAATWGPGRSDLGMSTSGRYAGYLVRRLPDLTIVAASIRVRALEGSWAPLPFNVTPPTSLPAGRYRLVLLAETTASVRIDLPGVSASYTATTPVPTAARFIDIGTAGRARVSSAVTAGRATFVAASVEAAYGQSSYAEACLAAVGYDCSTTSGGGGGFAYTSPGATRTHAQTGRLYVPGEMPVRTYDAVMSATSVGTNVVRKGFLLTIG